MEFIFIIEEIKSITTPTLIPCKNLTIIENSFRELKNNERIKIIINDGNTIPRVDIKEPKKPQTLYPIKDSYANSFIPFLTKNFEEIHVIDLRFYNSNINAYLNENNLKDILFFYNVKNFSEENNLIFINKLEED